MTHIDDDALALLKAYPWPGNIRQLENVIERAVVICDKPYLSVQELPAEIVRRPGIFDRGRDSDVGRPHDRDAAALPRLVRAERDQQEREQLVRALAAAAGNKAEAARAMGVARSTLVSRLKKLGLS